MVDLNIETVRESVDTPAVHSLVRSYLLARTFYEVTKEQVDAVYAVILREIPVFADREPGAGRRGLSGQRIYDHEKLYLTSDDDACQRVWGEAHKRLLAAGIKPATMSRDHCPALVAREQLSKVSNALADEAGKGMGLSAGKLLCHGLDRYYEFIDLVVGAIVSLPTFEKPKI